MAVNKGRPSLVGESQQLGFMEKPDHVPASGVRLVGNTGY